MLELENRKRSYCCFSNPGYQIEFDGRGNDNVYLKREKIITGNKNLDEILSQIVNAGVSRPSWTYLNYYAEEKAPLSVKQDIHNFLDALFYVTGTEMGTDDINECVRLSNFIIGKNEELNSLVCYDIQKTEQSINIEVTKNDYGIDVYADIVGSLISCGLETYNSDDQIYFAEKLNKYGLFANYTDALSFYQFYKDSFNRLNFEPLNKIDNAGVVLVSPLGSS